MKFISVLITLLSLFAFMGCTQEDINTLRVANPNAIMYVTFTSNGFKLECDKLQVKNYRLGQTVEAYFFAVNKTENILTPTILLDTSMNPEEFSQIEGLGYTFPPDNFENYISVEKVESIPRDEMRIYTIKLNIPDGETKVPDKFAFRTIIYGNTGGFTQVSPWVWWTVDMR